MCSNISPHCIGEVGELSNCHSPRTTVWAAVWEGGIFNPLFFHGNVTSFSYLETLKKTPSGLQWKKKDCRIKSSSFKTVLRHIRTSSWDNEIGWTASESLDATGIFEYAVATPFPWLDPMWFFPLGIREIWSLLKKISLTGRTEVQNFPSLHRRNIDLHV